MPFTRNINQLTIDHQTKIFDATEELIFLGQDYAFVKKDDETIGVIWLDDLLKEYHSGDTSEDTIDKFINPFFRISDYENQ